MLMTWTAVGYKALRSFMPEQQLCSVRMVVSLTHGLVGLESQFSECSDREDNAHLANLVFVYINDPGISRVEESSGVLTREPHLSNSVSVIDSLKHG